MSSQPGSAASEPLPLPAAPASVPGTEPHPLLQNALLEAAVLQSLLQICRHSPVSLLQICTHTARFMLGLVVTMTTLKQGHAHDHSQMLQVYVSQLTGAWPDVMLEIRHYKVLLLAIVEQPPQIRQVHNLQVPSRWSHLSCWMRVVESATDASADSRRILRVWLASCSVDTPLFCCDICLCSCAAQSAVCCAAASSACCCKT